MKTWKTASMLLLLASLTACQSTEIDATESVNERENRLESPANMETADTALKNADMGTDREGIEEKDLDKKSADFDPSEVTLGRDAE